MQKEIIVTNLIHSLVNQLKNRYEDTTLQNQVAWWLLEAITNKKKVRLISKHTIELTPEQIYKLDEWMVDIVVHHKPLAYILGSVPFGSLEILVRPPVLIARPETEEWTYKLIQKLKALSNKPLSILDLCSGSGAIGLALAQAFPQADVLMADILPQAVELAQENARHNHIYNAHTILSDLFSHIRTNKQFDLIVSNPPYIAVQEWEDLDPSVTEWEDRNALIADDDGLSIIKKIINQAPQFINPKSPLIALDLPQLFLEIGYQQGPTVKKLMEQAGYQKIIIEKDLEGKDRVVTGHIQI